MSSRNRVLALLTARTPQPGLSLENAARALVFLGAGAAGTAVGVAMGIYWPSGGRVWLPAVAMAPLCVMAWLGWRRPSSLWTPTRRLMWNVILSGVVGVALGMLASGSGQVHTTGLRTGALVLGGVMVLRSFLPPRR